MRRPPPRVVRRSLSGWSNQSVVCHKKTRMRPVQYLKKTARSYGQFVNDRPVEKKCGGRILGQEPVNGYSGQKNPHPEKSRVHGTDLSNATGKNRSRKAQSVKTRAGPWNPTGRKSTGRSIQIRT